MVWLVSLAIVFVRYRSYKKSKFIKLIWVLISFQELANIATFFMLRKWINYSIEEMMANRSLETALSQTSYVTRAVNIVTHWIFAY